MLAATRNDAMNLSIEVSAEMAALLHLEEPDTERRVLEALAVEAYRAGKLSRGKMSEFLGQSLWETEALLKERGCGLGLTFEEYERSMDHLEEHLDR